MALAGAEICNELFLLLIMDFFKNIIGQWIARPPSNNAATSNASDVNGLANPAAGPVEATSLPNQARGGGGEDEAQHSNNHALSSGGAGEEGKAQWTARPPSNNAATSNASDVNALANPAAGPVEAGFPHQARGGGGEDEAQHNNKASAGTTRVSAVVVSTDEAGAGGGGYGGAQHSNNNALTISAGAGGEGKAQHPGEEGSTSKLPCFGNMWNGGSIICPLVCDGNGLCSYHSVFSMWRIQNVSPKSDGIKVLTEGRVKRNGEAVKGYGNHGMCEGTEAKEGEACGGEGKQCEMCEASCVHIDGGVPRPCILKQFLKHSTIVVLRVARLCQKNCNDGCKCVFLPTIYNKLKSAMFLIDQVRQSFRVHYTGQCRCVSCVL